jgi:hypothetical protein
MTRNIKLPSGLDVLPKSVRERLENPPDPGSGVHTWIFSMALSMANVGLDPDDAVKLLGEYIPREPTPGDEIERQIAAAYQLKDTGQLGHFKRRPDFKFDPVKGSELLDLAKSGVNLQNLGEVLSAAASKEAYANPNFISTQKVLEGLYPEDPLICAGQFFGRPYTRKLSSFHPEFLAACSLIVPNPMIAERGLTTLGRESPRSENNVGPRKYAVIEADIKADNPFWATQLKKAEAEGLSAKDLSAAMISLVAVSMEMAVKAVVFSGNVSLHGWLDVEKEPYARIESLYRTAISYGACLSTWTLHQWVRMPNGTRWKEDPDRIQPSVKIGAQPLLYYVS